MNLKELKARGACVDMSPVKRTVTWRHLDEKTGEPITDNFDVWVTRLSFGVIDRLSKDDSERSRNAELISASIRLGEKGDEVIPYDVAYSLHTALALELVKAVGEVNRLKKTEGAVSPKG